jgi:hypothetical protein
MLSTLFAVFGAAAALRQISLHVIPGTPFYGSAFFGLHFYTWAFICFTIIIIGLSIIASFAKQYEKPLEQSDLIYAKQPAITKVSVLFALFILLFNALITFAECGPAVCPDNPTEYWLFK